MLLRSAVLALSASLTLAGAAAAEQVNQVATSSVAEPLVTPQCGGGVVYDDGGFNTGYTVGPGEAAIVMKLNLPAGTTTLDQACICFFRNASGSSSMNFDLVVYDDNGPGGEPGTPIASIPLSTSSLSTAPQFFSVDLTGAGIALPDTSVFVGARFPGLANIFLCGDTSGTTTQRTNFGSGYGGGYWETMTSQFPGNPPRAMGIRADPAAATAACVPSATAMCLNNNRFRVSATFDTGTQSGQAHAVELTDDTGYLWFFSATNVEAVIKVLNACVPAVGNRYWVFAGGLTNVNTVITVTDTQAGISKTYTNPPNTKFLPIQDTAAFATCP